MNMISYWLFFLSSVIMICSLFVEAGPASSGWTIYPPLSALPQAIPGSGTGMTLWLVSMAIFIASSLMGSLNYVVTVINLRTKINVQIILVNPLDSVALHLQYKYLTRKMKYQNFYQKSTIRLQIIILEMKQFQ